MKSLCIKTNNSNWLNYLLNELDNIELDNICFTYNKFKHYKNIIIHYTGNNSSVFYKKISSILAFLVIDEVDEELLERLILQNFFYFDSKERKQILELCFSIMADDFYELFEKKLNILSECFFDFISNNKSIVLTGFINFRLKSYLEILDEIINDAVSQFIVEKEYLEFISLLRLYINSQSSNSDIIHVVYSDSESILLDKNKEIIMVSKNELNAKYLSDISFSSNDYTLNSLLNLLPKKIYIHLIDSYIDEFINTLQIIFEKRVTVCTDCDICNLYRGSRNKAT